MDLLQVANDINAELVQIQLRYSYVFDKQEPATIFNSIITCITDDVADVIMIKIIDRRDPHQIFIQWFYDLRNRQYPQRGGPRLEDILQKIKELPQNIASLRCTLQLSSHFRSLDRASQERLLRHTIWGKSLSEQQKLSLFNENQPETSDKNGAARGSAFSGRAINVDSLELELLKLASEANVFDKSAVSTIRDSVKKSLDADHIQGVHLELMEDDKRLLLEWDYKLSADFKLIREGTSLEQVLNIINAVNKRHVKLLVHPILSVSFQQLSAKMQHEVMKDTIWASSFKRRIFQGL